jgi:hypothetical protein
MDFSALIGAISATDVAAAGTAILAMAAFKVAPGFTKWIANKVAGFFR